MDNDIAMDPYSDDTESYSIESPGYSQADTEEYYHCMSSPESSEASTILNLTGIWGPVRLYREAHMDDPPRFLEWLMDTGILFNRSHCSYHHIDRRLRFEGDKPVWYCGRCDKRKSVYVGSIFEDSNLNRRKVLMLALNFAYGTTYDDTIRNSIFAANDVPMTNQTIAHWHFIFRDKITQHAAACTANQERIGGDGHIVQVDEMKIGRRKYNRGRLVNGTWVLGMVDTTTGEVRYEVVENRSSDALIPVIARHVARYTEVWTDQLRSYSTAKLQDLWMTHKTVNHSREFVTTDGVHTQQIESCHRVIRRHFSPGGVRYIDVPQHLCEIVWRNNCKKANLDPFNELLKLLKA